MGCGTGELLTQYAAQYARLTELRRRLRGPAAKRPANGRRDEEWLRFQTEELTSANLRPGEQAELEEELAVLENADRIGEALTSLRNAFDADGDGVRRSSRIRRTNSTISAATTPPPGNMPDGCARCWRN